MVGESVPPQTGGSACGDMARSATQRLVKSALQTEAEAIAVFASHSDRCVDAIYAIAATTGPLVVSGIGKSGLIGRKIAATFRSLGKQAVFLHAAEASHGDLGLVQPGSIVLILSNSGETDELSDLIFYCRSHEIRIIAMTADGDSTLARASSIAIVYGDVEEVCMKGLAPSTSTTLCLAIGDTLVAGVCHLQGILPEDFRRYHPGGKLGSCLATVGDLMRTGDALPIVAPDTPMAEVVVTMSAKALGVAVVVEDDRVVGIITDGDMRRHIDRLWISTAAEIATPNPIYISGTCLASEALYLLNQKRITVCVVNGTDGCLDGLLHVHDCLSVESTLPTKT